MVYAALLIALAGTPAAGSDEPWTPIFDGKTLDGWQPKIAGFELGENHLDTFRVRDGAIQVSYDKYETFANKFGHLFYKEKLSHYRIRMEYRFVGEQCPGGPGWAKRNSGIMLHCQDPAAMPRDQNFPVSIEFQFLGGLGKGDRPTGCLCTPGTHVVHNGKLYTPHTLNSKAATIHGDDWVRVEAEVNGAGTIRHFVNGEQVLEYEQPQYDPNDKDAKPLIPKTGELLIHEGYVSLQAESHPVEFRSIEIRKMKPPATP